MHICVGRDRLSVVDKFLSVKPVTDNNNKEEMIKSEEEAQRVREKENVK